MNVRDWLKSLGLERYEAAFRENDVNADVLPNLMADDLKDLGITSVGHRRQLLIAIAKLQDESMWSQAAKPSGDHAVSIPAEDVVSHAGERRQLTVMFCDLVGSTALSAKLDPEELRDLLHAYRTLCDDVIARYDGFVARYVGDGILTYFGWPAAHEDDAERAVRAALEIVETVKRASTIEVLSVHIGIATGPVVVGESAGVGDQAKLAVGSTPNFAARLQGLAAADQIVIAASTRRLIGNAFDLSDLGEHDLKGIAEPIHAWRVECVAVTDSRFDAHHTATGLTPLVGREGEVDLLLRRWAQARNGEGQVVLLGGEPGIGKSRILTVLRERLEARGVQALRVQCSPYYVNSAFWPAIDNLERALKFARDETPESKLDKLEALVVGDYGRPLADVRFVASILSIPCEERYGALAMTPQRHKDETLRTLVDITEAAARRQPSVLLFEDVHWADPTTLEMLDLLIDRVKTVPLLVVLTHRPEFQPRWSGHGHVGALSLSKLTRTQSTAMISALAGGKALPGPLLEQILIRTDGVPLFVEELTKAVLESGELKDASGYYEYSGSARSVTIPATLRDSLMARLDRFMPVKEVAQIGAAIGREFSYELIEAVAPMPQAQLDDALARLCEAGLAFRRGTPPDAIYSFKHVLVRDTAYSSLLCRWRREMHKRIAEAIEASFPSLAENQPELLAYHLTEAGMSEAAVAWWSCAGERELRRSANLEASSHLQQALDLLRTLPVGPERDRRELELRMKINAPLQVTKGFASAEVERNITRALSLRESLDEAPATLPLLWGGCVTSIVRCDLRVALDKTRIFLRLAESASDADAILTGHRGLGHILLAAGDVSTAFSHFEHALKRYDPRRRHVLVANYALDPRPIMLSQHAMVMQQLGRRPEATALVAHAWQEVRRPGHYGSNVYGAFHVALFHMIEGDAEAVKEVAAELLLLSQHHGGAYWTLQFEVLLGWCQAMAGETDAGLERMQRAEVERQRIQAKLWTPLYLAEKARLLIECDRAGEARHWLDTGLSVAEATGQRFAEAELHRLRALALAAEGACKEVTICLDRAQKMAQSRGAWLWEQRAISTRAKLMGVGRI